MGQQRRRPVVPRVGTEGEIEDADPTIVMRAEVMEGPQSPQELDLVTDAVGAEHPADHQMSARCPLPHDAGDERAVPGLRVELVVAVVVQPVSDVSVDGFPRLVTEPRMRAAQAGVQDCHGDGVGRRGLGRSREGIRDRSRHVARATLVVGLTPEQVHRRGESVLSIRGEVVGDQVRDVGVAAQREPARHQAAGGRCAGRSRPWPSPRQRRHAAQATRNSPRRMMAPPGASGATS